MKKRGGKVTQTLDETGTGKFTFPNGDTYDGEYKLNHDREILVKDGSGTYTTDNFDVYEGVWDNDLFADSEIYIKYNNDAQFRGRIESNGTMNGPGTYTFPDGSSVEAIWVDNIPSLNIIYREPGGYSWMPKDVSQDTISFFPGNHFWDDVMSAESSKYSAESLQQEEEN